MENIIKGISGGLKFRHILGLISTAGLSYLLLIFFITQEKDIFNKIWDAYKITFSLLFNI